MTFGITHWRDILDGLAILIVISWLWGFAHQGSHKQAMADAAQHDAKAETAHIAAKSDVRDARTTSNAMDHRAGVMVPLTGKVTAEAAAVTAEAQLVLDHPEVLALADHSRELALLALANEDDRKTLVAKYEAASAHYELTIEEKDEEIKVLKVEAEKPKLTAKRAVGLVLIGAALVKLLPFLL